MRWKIVILLLIACRGVVTTSKEPMILDQIRKIMDRDPLETMRLFSLVQDSAYQDEKERLLLTFYLQQREYYRADSLLSRVGVSRETTFLIKTKVGDQPYNYAPDLTAKIIQYALCRQWEMVKGLASLLDTTDPLVRFYYLRALLECGDSTPALKFMEGMDTIPSYLAGEFYRMKIELLLWANPEKAEEWIDSLSDPALRLYYRYQVKKDDRYLWQIIRRYPRGWAGDFALRRLRPKTRHQRYLYARARFRRGEYERALRYLKPLKGDEALFLIGMCYLRLGRKEKAYGYLRESGLPEAYYEIAQSLPDSEAISYYRLVVAKQPKRSLLRRSMVSQALALERLGRLSDAVAVELKFVREFPGTNTSRRLRLRAAINLIRLGELERADSLLATDSLSAYYYWRGRIQEMVGRSPDSIYNRLRKKHPFSYYTIYRLRARPRLDTISLVGWVEKMGGGDPDTAIFPEVRRLTRLGLYEYADQLLFSYRPRGPKSLYYAALFARELGYDWHRIRFAYRLLRMGVAQGKDRFPVELLRLTFPIFFLPSLKETGIELPLLAALIWQESNFNPGAVSPAGAIGLLQIMPRTGRLIGQELSESDPDLYRADLSIRYGSYYLKKLRRELGSWLYALIGYNAGPHRVRRWTTYYPEDEEIFIELIPFVETRNYIKRILWMREIYRWLLELGDLT
ncbi:hypothetical protein DRP53_09770 [candidate division WOR-3 bacterium]|uniref:Transglycosylase SLT domain-containing protein n=1 Tax=candidate division WOR-3 bacterium TaxID=2052148 RepID=A0A660SFX5_UNCW3|nr:MAG: hypothetical protein DRP53_09770 [candidate division WOR-3 bacterium]